VCDYPFASRACHHSILYTNTRQPQITGYALATATSNRTCERKSHKEQDL